MGVPALIVLMASFVTVLEFPIYFGNVVASDGLGVTLLFIRNGLLVVAAVLAAVELWRSTVSPEAEPPVPTQAARTTETSVTS